MWGGTYSFILSLFVRDLMSIASLHGARLPTSPKNCPAWYWCQRDVESSLHTFKTIRQQYEEFCLYVKVMSTPPPINKFRISLSFSMGSWMACERAENRTWRIPEWNYAGGFTRDPYGRKLVGSTHQMSLIYGWYNFWSIKYLIFGIIWYDLSAFRGSHLPAYDQLRHNPDSPC